jgi:mono/diheme cytochrome c family protein
MPDPVSTLWWPQPRDSFPASVFQTADMQNRLKIKWLLAAVALLCIGSGIYYADLLRSAFLRNPIPRSAESIARGRLLFARNCAVCHGAEGRGDGVAAAALPQRPEDLSRIAPPPIFPDGVVAYRIINGVKMMPAFKSTLSENEIWDLLNFIRSLAKR